MSCARTVALVLGAVLVSGAVEAQPAPAPTTGSAAVDGDESPELRALRLAELALFADQQPLVRAGGPSPLGTPPAAVTSDVAPRAPTVAGTDADMSWLQGLSLPDIPVRWDDRVVRYLRFFRDDPQGRSFIRSWRERSGRYGPMVRARLREDRLPEDLFYVAMVESGFDPRARSGAGAVGMWQFVQGTGEEYGLAVTHWEDQRMDPVLATGAAARYLGDLYRRFGSWELAFAAYNMGYGALLRAIRKYNTNDFWVLARIEAGLPFETTFYVAKVMACAIVGRNPARFGLDPARTDRPLRYDEVQVPAGMPLSVIARAAHTTSDAIRELNPSMLRQRVPAGESDRTVRVPPGQADSVTRAAARARNRPALVAYIVRFGETIDSVARRFRTTVAELRDGNELSENERVGAGTRLLVPAVEPLAPEVEEQPTIAVASSDFSYPDRQRVFYRIVDGDRAAEVAQFFGVAVDDLCRWNNIDPGAALQTGMFLQLFVPPDVDLSRAVVLMPDEVRILVVGTDEFFDYHEAQRGRARVRHRIRAGDTLTSLGRRFDLSVGSLARINRIPTSTVLRVGDEIIVYAPASQAPAAATPAPEVQPAAAEVPVPGPAPSEAAAPSPAPVPEAPGG